ncbi:MAG TPA: aromatic acid decarboxylase [Cyanobacteria bacterium UBA8156]|jgi:4-hydroxy-3-polyprenylbenzoate decarboxylase|nr:aromatic acid decarboxylase [Cyanobacteria bacterium UBA8156]
MSRPLAVGVSGASGMVYAVRLLKYLLQTGHTVELVASKGAQAVWREEGLGVLPATPEQQATFWREQCQETGGVLRCHNWADLGATLASGSYRTQGMIVIPCSMGTVAKIAAGLSTDLLERAADVHLKEGRPLVVVPRETPFSVIHLRNLLALAEAGVRVVPAIPAWYHRPQTIEDLVDFVVARVLDQLGIDVGAMVRWRESDR